MIIVRVKVDIYCIRTNPPTFRKYLFQLHFRRRVSSFDFPFCKFLVTFIRVFTTKWDPKKKKKVIVCDRV